MPDQEQNNVGTSHHREGETVIFDRPVDPVEAARQRRESEQHEFARQQVNTNKWLVRFTFALVFATFCTIGVGIWQNSISRRLAQIAEAQLRIDDRPWLKVEVTNDNPLGAGKPVVAGVRITNIGKTPATQVMIVTKVAVIPVNKEPDLPDHMLAPKMEMYNPPVGTTGKSAGAGNVTIMAVIYPTDHEDIVARRLADAAEYPAFPLSIQEATDINAKKDWVMVFGEVWYTDILGQIHWTRFCADATTNANSENCFKYSALDHN
ncbi:MAG: hypothetical protein ABSD43_13375 [Terracidiphilus sp.]